MFIKSTGRLARRWKSIKPLHRVAFAYLLTVLTGIVAGLFYSYSLPETYTAEKVLVDEYKEMDVIIGTNSIKQMLRQKMAGNTGIDNLEVYAQMAGTWEFANELSRVTIPDYGLTYLQYVRQFHKQAWWESDYGTMSDDECIEHIRSCIKYRVGKHRKLTLQVDDPDPVVSALIVDTVCQHLLNYISERRKANSAVRLKDLQVICAKAEDRHKRLLGELSSYVDSHANSTTAEVNSIKEELRQKVRIALTTYQSLHDELLREEMLHERIPQSFNTLKDTTVPLHPTQPHYLLNILAITFVLIIIVTWALLYKYVDNKGRPVQFGNLFSPWSITTLIWAAILIGLFLVGDELYPLSTQFYICLAIWVTIFCVSSFTTFNLLPRMAHSVRKRLVTVPFNTYVFNFFFFISVCITPLYLYSILNVVSMFGTEDMVSNIRILAVHGHENYGYLALSYVLNQALLIMALWYYPRIPFWKLLLVYCMAFMNAFAIMEKGMLFYIVIITLFVLYEKRLLRMRSVGLSLGAIVVLFFIINLFRADEETYAEETTLLDFFAMYVLSPPVAFGTLSPDISLLPGTHTFQVIYNLLNNWGFGPYSVDTGRVQEFAFVPIPTNIYTIFQPFFEDFEYKGIAFFALVYGTFSGWMYRLYQNGNAVGKTVYTYLIYLLVLQFYQEYFILNIVQFVQFVFFTMLVQQRFIGFNFNIKRA